MIEDRLWIGELMICIQYQHRVHRPRQARIRCPAEHQLDVVFGSRQRPKPKEQQWKSADILCDDATVSPNQRRKLECEVSRSTSEINDYAPGLKIQGPHNLDRPLPLVTFSLYLVQQRNRIERRIPNMQDKDDSDRAKEKNQESGAILQRARSRFPSGSTPRAFATSTSGIVRPVLCSTAAR